MIKFFFDDWKKYGFRVACHNLVFLISAKILGAKKMTVVYKKYARRKVAGSARKCRSGSKRK